MLKMSQLTYDGDRCKGECCRIFNLPYSPEELWEKYDDWMAEQRGGRARRRLTVDIHLVVPMVRFVMHLKAGERDPIDGYALYRDQWYYTCVHLDRETGDCSIYEHRPEMCIRYPYGNRCRYKGCKSSLRFPLEAAKHAGKVVEFQVEAHELVSWIRRFGELGGLWSWNRDEPEPMIDKMSVE